MVDAIRGFDSSVDCSKIAPAVKAAGYSYVARYYGPLTSRNKKILDRKEALGITLPGLLLVSLWEGAGNLYSSFTTKKGAADAKAAGALGKLIGQPLGSAIYFTVDFDASAVQIADGVTDYFRAAKTVLDSVGYKVGVYGSGSTCSAIKGGKLASFAMLACATGWRGSKQYRGYDILQGMPTTLHGLPIDPETTIRPGMASGEFGAWTLQRGYIAKTPAIARLPKSRAA